MGRVYQARDRLTGQLVALKQVTVPAPELNFGANRQRVVGAADPTVTLAVAGLGAARAPATAVVSNDDTLSLTPGRQAAIATGASPIPPSELLALRVAITQEFNLLATLRHPNIITVRDHGFDEERRPFFTMDYLADARPLLGAAADLPLAGRVTLVAQILEALAYLHRQGIVHRDLKPANVLVSGGQVKVLDFGLSLQRSQAGLERGIFGTLAYMAPELLRGAPATEASDLYAVGLIAFEIFAGRRLLRGKDLGEVSASIEQRTVDLAEAGLEPALTAVLQRLLARSPAQRFERAGDALVALCEATAQPVPSETLEIRESFLQAARFVGREPELATLTKALNDTIAGGGGAWLVGGESGVGKSRLCDELRTRALVCGAQVLRGRAVEQGGDAFELWRDAFRLLAMYADPDDDDAAAALRAIIPDIETLLQRPVAREEPLDPQATGLRLVEVVVSLLRRVGGPVVIFLEDLQWAGADALAMLARLERAARELPVLLVGTYRDDECPDLPAQLPDASVLRLRRLSRGEIGALSASMLGPPGSGSGVLEFLHRETEGNVFFVVEAVRALAEEAGALERVASMALPARVSSGNLERLLERRLDRLPAGVRPLLVLAAAAGRRIDEALLRRLAPAVNFDHWLATCAGAAVLAVEDESWHFAHDKLREATVAGLDRAERALLHRRLAEEMEGLYAAAPAHAAALAYHWGAAGDDARELVHAERAGQHAARLGANTEAARFLERALELLLATPVSPQRAGLELGLQLGLGSVLMASRGFGAPGVERAFGRALELARLLGDSPLLFPVLWGLWSFNNVCGNLAVAEDLARQFRSLAETTNNAPLLAASSHLAGGTQFWQGRPREARPRLQHFLAHVRREDPTFQVASNEDPEVSCLVYEAWTAWLLGHPDQSLAGCQRAVELASSMSAHTQAFALGFSTWVHQYSRADLLARRRAEASIALATKHEFPFWLGAAQSALGSVQARGGEVSAGIVLIRGGLELYRATGARLFKPTILAALAEACMFDRQLDEARSALDEALAEIAQTGERVQEPELWRLDALLSHHRGDAGAAEAGLRRAIDVANRQGSLSFELRAAADLSGLLEKAGRGGEALTALDDVYGRFSEGFDTSDLVGARTSLARLRAHALQRATSSQPE